VCCNSENISIFNNVYTHVSTKILSPVGLLASSDRKKTVTPSHLECMVNILMFTSKKIYIKTDKGMASVFLEHAIKK
jgi:hypothetical protein